MAPVLNKQRQAYMIAPDGATRALVDVENYERARAAGYSDEPEDSITARLVEKKYQDRGGTAFALGLASGVVPIIGPAIAKELLPSDIDPAKVMEHNPGSYAVGEGVGFAGSMLIPGASPARAALAGGRLAASGAAKVAARVGAKATGRASRVGGALAKSAVQGGVEGAGLGAMSSASESVYNNDNLQQAAFRMWGGATSGGLFGGALGAGGKATAALLGVVTKPVKNTIRQAHDLAASKVAMDHAGVAAKEADDAIVAARKAVDDKFDDYLREDLDAFKAGKMDEVKLQRRRQMWDELRQQEIAEGAPAALRAETQPLRDALKEATENYARTRVQLGNFLAQKVAGKAIAAAGATAGAAGWGLINGLIPGAGALGGYAAVREGVSLIRGDTMQKLLGKLRPTTGGSVANQKQFDAIVGGMRKKYAPHYSKTYKGKRGEEKTWVGEKLLVGEWAAEKMGSLLGPESFAARMPRAASALRIGQAMISTAVKGSSISALTNEETTTLARNVHEVGQDALTDVAANAAMAGMGPQDIAAVQANTAAGIDRLKQTSPIQPGSDKLRLSKIEELAFKDRTIAQTDPEMAVSLITAGKGSPAMVDQLLYSYPEYHRSIVKAAETADALRRAGGVKYSREQERMISLLLSGRSASRHAQLLQQSYGAQQAQRQKTKNVKIDAANKARSFADAAAARMAKG